MSFLFAAGKKKKKTRRKTRKANCFAGRSKKNKTCYADKSIIQMKELWNTKHPDKKIVTRQPNQIWEKLNENLNNVCDTEMCWLEQKFIDNGLRDKLEKTTFAPKQPKKWKIDPNTWLNSLDISKVMKQYEHDHKNFNFLGPSPIDFDDKLDGGKCVWDDICKCVICEKYQNGVHKIGFIFNLDPHYKGGSHWVSLFVDLDKNFIFFMDSNGDKIPDEVKELVNRIKQQGKEGLHKKLRFIDNAPMEHQYENTECGIYSLYTLIHLLQEKTTPQKLRKKRIPDEDMEEFRSIYFNES